MLHSILQLFRRSSAAASLSIMALAASCAMGANRPNVIVIMADDLGAEGLGCYGSTIYTSPNLDRMASEGMRFNNAYATPLCTPTRAMIMSGTYPNRNGFRALIGKEGDIRMPAEIKTFGNYFKDASYQTAMAGKWQLGQFDVYPNQPVEHGFDNYCMWTWFYGGKKNSRYYAPQIYTNGKIMNGSKEDYGPDFYSRFLLDFIDQNKDKPFFIYYPMALVHSPFDIPPKLKELASKKFTSELDKDVVAWGHMITYADDIVGKIMERLKANGLDKNTLVIFTADNGTHSSLVSRLPGMELKGGKGSLTEAGCRVPFLAWWPGTVKPAVKDEFICLVDVLPTICSVAGIGLTAETDGMDLSHYFTGREGMDREQVLMSFKSGYFVRDKRFRLNEDGKLYDIPVTSDKERYSEKVTTNPEYNAERERLQKILDEYMALPPLYDGATKADPGAKKESKKERKGKKNAPSE